MATQASKKPSARVPKPDQDDINSLAAFIEIVEELRQEPFFGAQDKTNPPAPQQARLQLRSALITFRRLWAAGQPASFASISELLNRFDKSEPQISLIAGRHRQHAERTWPNFSLTASEVVDLWLDSLFGTAAPEVKKRSQWQSRINFDTLTKARGRGFLEGICRTTVSALTSCYFDLLKIAQATLARWEREYELHPEFAFVPAVAAAPVETIAPSPLIVLPDPIATAPASIEPQNEKFDRILATEPFKGLKAIMASLTSNREALYEAVNVTSSYEEFLKHLGYTLSLTRQIHVQDCYLRLGTPGGIRAVLPYHDIPSQSTLPTLVNFDSTVTATPKSAAFFNDLLAKLKSLTR